MNARWLVLVLGAVGCSDISIVAKDPDPPIVVDTDRTDTAVVLPEFYPVIDVTPPIVDFGYVEEGTSITADLLVSNLGTAALSVEDLAIDGSPTFSLVGDSTSRLIAPGESDIVTVRFTPANRDETGAFTFSSNDQFVPTGSVDLLGTGKNPLVVGSPNPLQFSSLPLGGTEVKFVTLTNTGNHRVNVTGLTVTNPAFQMGTVPSNIPIQPGGTYQVGITFAPPSAGNHEGVLQIASDARVPAVDVQLLGGSAGRPTAICDVNPASVSAIHESAQWRGNQSTDPAGLPLTYNWQLITRPPGSTVPFNNGNGAANRGPFFPDIVGTYQAQLVVTNSQGQSSAPCVATLEARTNGSLWVEMSWQHRGDDMDLHLLFNGGARQSSQDCYYANCVGGGPNWGASGSADNPVLDLDDIPGTGPENINILAPANGTYRVEVHDYPGSTYQAANQVRVRIYTGGVLAYDQTKSISGENTYTPFATINWSGGSGTITPL